VGSAGFCRVAKHGRMSPLLLGLRRVMYSHRERIHIDPFGAYGLRL
jgi:hypothetical protein